MPQTRFVLKKAFEAVRPSSGRMAEGRKMKKKIGFALFSIGALGYLIMGSALDSPDWKLALILAVIFFGIAVVGYRIYESCRRFEQETKEIADTLANLRKQENRNRVWNTWLETKEG